MLEFPNPVCYKELKLSSVPFYPPQHTGTVCPNVFLSIFDVSATDKANLFPITAPDYQYIIM